MATAEEVKTFSGGMNKDDDPRFLPQGDYIDALNLSSNTTEGSGGVLVSAIGNEEIFITTPSGANPTDDPYTFRRAFDAHTDVVTADDKIHIFSHQWATADSVSYTQNSGTVINPLVDGTTYYVIRVDENNIKLATSAVNAEAGTPIVLTSKPTATEVQFITSATSALPNGNNRVIGAKDDKLRGHTYYFVYNDTGAHSILRYEYENNFCRVILQEFQYDQAWSTWNPYLSGEWVSGITSAVGDIVWYEDKYYVCKSIATDNTIVPITDWHTWDEGGSYLAFNDSFPITHVDVIEKNDTVFLLWTDNNIEPSKINVTRLLESARIDNYPPMVREYVDAYAYAPQLPLKVAYGVSAGVTNNATARKLWQFKYRWVYRDGEVSAFSPVSKVPLPTVATYLDASPTVDSKIDMEVYTRDRYNYDVTSPTIFRSTVKYVEVYARILDNNNVGNYSLVKTIDTDVDSIGQTSSPDSDEYSCAASFSFENKNNSSNIDVLESDQLYDFLPRKAAAQTIISNRVTYGNILEGYNIPTPPELTLDGSYSSAALSAGQAPKRGFKNGSKHPIGIIYSDGKGRLSTVVAEETVNLLYASDSNKQQSNIEVNINLAPPSWAEFYHIVWGGNQTKSDWTYFGTNGTLTSGSTSVIDIDSITDFNAEYSSVTSLDGTNLYYNYSFEAGDVIVPLYAELPYVSPFNANTDVDLGTDKITITAHRWATEDAVVYSDAAGTPIGGLVDATTYYVIKVDADTIQLATTAVNAGLGTSIPLTSKPASETHTLTGVDVGYWATAHGTETGVIKEFDSSASPDTLTVDTSAWSSAPRVGDVYEIYTPKESQLDSFWYEIGASFKIYKATNGTKYHGGSSSDFAFNRDQTPSQTARVKLDAGDSYFFLMDSYISGSFSGAIAGYETNYVSPIFTSESTSIGRPNVISRDYGETRYENQLSYSEPYLDNTNFFGISRFYSSNFNDSLNPSYGKVTVMSSSGNEVFVLQEERVARLLANKYYIYTGDLSAASIGQTQQFLSEPSYFPQEYGCQNPESFSSFSGSKFWVDKSRGSVLKASGGGITKISDVKMSTFFEDKLTYPFKYNAYTGANNGLIYSGYNLRDSEYILNMDSFDIITRPMSFSTGTEYKITFTQDDADLGLVSALTDIGSVPIRYSGSVGGWDVKSIASSTSTTIDVTISGLFPAAINTQIYVPKVETIAWNDQRERWSGRYSFNPEWITDMADGVATFSNGAMYNHIESIYRDVSDYPLNTNRFYGTVYDSLVTVPLNQSPTKNKVLIALNVESNQAWRVLLATNNRGQSTNLEITDFELLEGQYWSNFLRDRNTPTAVAGAYPLLDGDEMRDVTHELTLSTSVSDGAVFKLFSITGEQLYSPIS